MASPKIKLYTSRGCPWAHRAHIILAELNLPFEEETIDLAVPRTPEYLKVNPRGLVPSLAYDGEIITESGIVAQFLADAHPSHLLPTSDAEGGALRRARVNFFADTFVSKLLPLWTKAYLAEAGELDALRTQFSDVVLKELEPLLADAGPFFGGSEKLTFAEVLSGSFVVRLVTFPKYGLVPEDFFTQLADKTPNFFKWAQAVAKHPSVTGSFDEEKIARLSKAKIDSIKAERNQQK